MAKSITDRLSNVAENSIGCLEWQGKLTKKGYVRIRYKGRSVYGHRLVKSLELGRELTEEELVRHGCDNRRCINAAHLVFGTCLDNVQDMIERGRRAKISKRRRLTLLEVIKIKLWLSLEHGCESIAGRIPCGETDHQRHQERPNLGSR